MLERNVATWSMLPDSMADIRVGYPSSLLPAETTEGP